MRDSASVLTVSLIDSELRRRRLDIQIHQRKRIPSVAPVAHRFQPTEPNACYDLEDEPAAQLTDQWPVLPAAAQITSTDGEQLLAAARDRTAWTDQSAVDNDCEPTTYLYDEGGSGIRDEQRLATLLDNAGDDAWLVPAIALQQTPDECEPECQDSLIPIKELLECHQCGRTTDHRFSDHESVPDETWTGNAIWECQVCGTPRYGPSPE